jgi:hypothetical protein
MLQYNTTYLAYAVILVSRAVSNYLVKVIIEFIDAEMRLVYQVERFSEATPSLFTYDDYGT